MIYSITHSLQVILQEPIVKTLGTGFEEGAGTGTGTGLGKGDGEGLGGLGLDGETDLGGIFPKFAFLANI